MAWGPTPGPRPDMNSFNRGMRDMRRLILPGLLLMLGAGTAMAQAARKPAAKAPPAKEEEEVERKIVGGGKIPTGWVARTDRDAPLSKVKVETTPAGLHIETATILVLYRPTDQLSNNYHLGASFTQNDGSPGHAEPYGLILGGTVKGDTLAYTYFLVDGE